MEESELSKEVREKLNQMSFRKLKELIENCLKPINESNKQENLDLLTTEPKQLKEYVGILENKIISLPALPTFKDTKSLKSESFIAKLEKLKKDLNRAYFQLKTAEQKKKWNVAAKYKRSFDNLKKKIRDIERSEPYLRILKEEKQKIIAYKNYQKEKEEYESKLETFKIQHRILERIRGNIENINQVTFQLTTLNWKLLPKGEMPFNRLKSYLSEISKVKQEEVDYEKIEKIISLKADKIYCGIDEFAGYLVFYFEKAKIAVLDCPKKGNAIYVFGENWKTLSRLTKSELLNYHHDKMVRIIHVGEWFQRLKTCISFYRNKSI